MKLTATTLALTTGLSAGLSAGLTHASLTTYDTRAAFDGATGPQTIETFEPSALGPIAMPGAFASGLTADLFNGSVSSFIEAGDPDGYGFQNSTDGGRKYLRFGQNIPGAGAQTGSYTVAFGFGGLVNAFGFDLSGFQPQDAADGFNLSLLRDGQLVEDIFVPAQQFYVDLRFFGFVGTQSFDTARVNIPVLNTAMTADYVAFDGVTWAVPSPAGVSLLAGAGLLGARRRRAS